MGLMKINQILKKYKELHKKHKASWEESSKKIRAADGPFPNESVYMQESYNYQRNGNKLFDALMQELEGHDIFPKKTKNDQTHKNVK